MNPNLLYLAQSDTTVGFLSQNPTKIINAKKRDNNKPFLITVSSLKLLKKFTKVPKIHKNRVRRAKKSSFIYSNNLAIRVVKENQHLDFLKKIEWSFSSSANISSYPYDEKFAKKSAEVIIEDKRGLFEGKSSKIFKINKVKIRQLR